MDRKNYNFFGQKKIDIFGWKKRDFVGKKELAFFGQIKVLIFFGQKKYLHFLAKSNDIVLAVFYWNLVYYFSCKCTMAKFCQLCKKISLSLSISMFFASNSPCKSYENEQNSIFFRLWMQFSPIRGCFLPMFKKQIS